MASYARSGPVRAYERGDSSMHYLSDSVSRACDRFLASRGELVGIEAKRHFVKRSIELHKFAAARQKQYRKDRVEAAAIELEQAL